MKKAFYIGAAVSAGISALFAFALVGYRMMALAFLGLAAVLALFGALSGRHTAAARRMKVTMIVILLIGAGCFLAAEIPVLMDCRSAADTAAPHLIVCGAGVHGSVPSRSLTDRLRAALDWLQANPDADAVLSGCQGPGEDLSEAQAMFDWLAERGVDPARLILEDRATDSYENIQYSLALLGPDPGRVAILSSEYHLHRLGYMAEKLGCEPVPVAARTSNPVMFLNYAVREAFAMWKLWVFGP